jgi:hypothetical protein
MLFNAFTDYWSLFVVRPLLVWSSTKAVIGLALATLSGAAIVILANTLRTAAIGFQPLPTEGGWGAAIWEAFLTSMHLEGVDGSFPLPPHLDFNFFMWPAIVVFTWLPLFALGILIIRALTPLSWIVAKAQWALKEGDKHPLKAIGYVAAVAVFAIAVGLRVIFVA